MFDHWGGALDPESLERSQRAIDLESASASCPACGSEFPTSAARCPDCGLRFR